MQNHSTFIDGGQPPDDYIDFPVSDTFRDHYAAQGLTYSSGRSSRKTENRGDSRLLQPERGNKALAKERNEWMSRAMKSEAQCEQLKEKYERLQRQYNKLNQQDHRFQRPPESNESQEYRGVDLDACA
jgi:hypothetical protein